MQLMPDVPSDGQVAVAVSYDNMRGTVTGAGTYKAGTKVTLKAKANKGYVFAGWYDGTELLSLDPAFKIVMPETDLTFTASFILAVEDGAKIAFMPEEEYSVGEIIDSAVVDLSGCTSLPKVTVKGLPPGLKFNAKTLTITGTPKKSGIYTVTATVKTAGKSTASDTRTVIVRKPEERVLVSDWDPAAGKVSGGGVFAPGRKVTLKAKANKGYVFAGWYTNANLTTPCDSSVTDYRNPSYAYSMGETDAAIYAKFVTKADEAADTMRIALYSEEYADPDTAVYQFEAGEVIEPLRIEIESLSLPKIKVKGLPAGLKYTAKALTVKAAKTTDAYFVPANSLYGTPKTPGDYAVTIEAVNASKSCSVTKTFDFHIRHFDGHGIHTTDNGEYKPVILEVEALAEGEIFLPGALAGLLDPVTVKSVKLPSGLSYDKKTGIVKGNGRIRCGDYTATLTDTEGRVTTFTVEVNARDRIEFTEWGPHGTLQCNDYEEAGFVQGEPGLIEVASVMPLNGAKLKICVTGLPKGIRTVTESEGAEQTILFMGKTTAAAGRYPVKIQITDAASGYIFESEEDYYVLPKPPSAWYGTYSAEQYDFPIVLRDSRGRWEFLDGAQAGGEVTITVTETARISAYRVVGTYLSVYLWNCVAAPPLDRVCVYVSTDGTKIGYCYSFWDSLEGGDEVYCDLIFWVKTDAAGNLLPGEMSPELCCGYESEVQGLAIAPNAGAGVGASFSEAVKQ